MGQLTLLLAIHNHQPDGNFGHVFEQAYADCYRPLIEVHRRVPVGEDDAAPHRSAPRVDRARAAGLLRQAARARRARPGRAPRRRLLRADAGGAARARRARADRDDVRLPRGALRRAARGHVAGRARLGAGAGQAHRRRRHEVHARRRRPLPRRRPRGHAARLLRHREGGDAAGAVPHRQEAARGDPVLEGVGVDRRHRQAARRDATATPRSPTATTARSSASGRTPKSGSGTRAGCAIFCARSSSGSSRARSRPSTSASTCARIGRRAASICRRRRTRRWASGRCRPTRRSTTTEVRQGLKDRGELDRARAFFRGGIWQNFLAKYPEANYLHKKMVWVSDKLERAEQKLGPGGGHALDHARRELYRAQCNCGYWHGLFGGLYLNYLRDAIYRHLIEAEAHAERVLGTGDKPLVIEARHRRRPAARGDPAERRGRGLREAGSRRRRLRARLSAQALQPAQRARAARRGLSRAPARGGAQERAAAAAAGRCRSTI